MARRVRSRAVFVRPPARTKIWIGNGLGATTLVSGATLVSSLNAAALALRPFTILRTRIVISLLSDQVAATEFLQAVYARIVVTDSAVTAGIASVPTPLSEPEASFYVYEPLFNNILVGATPGIQENTGAANVTVVDSKAMRKVGIDDDVAGILHQRSAGLGSDLAIEGRTLIQLH